MIYLYLAFLCGTFQYIHIPGVLCRRQPLERFLKEEGVKPPIFGSYNFDPIKQVFDVVPDENNTQLIGNGSYYSTAYPAELEAGDNAGSSQRYFIFRKHATETAPTLAVKYIHLNENATSLTNEVKDK